MLDRFSKWLEQALPWLIFIFAILVGAYLGFWAQNAIIILAIVYYALRGEPTAERLQNQLLLLALYAAVMAYANLNTRATLLRIEDICEEGSRVDEDQCSRILWEIKDNGSSEYDYYYDYDR
jgi:hypothetical protein